MSTVHVSNTSFLYPVDDMPLLTPDGVVYHRILNPAIAPRDSDRPLRFYAISFHPGLRRTADYQVHRGRERGRVRARRGLAATPKAGGGARKEETCRRDQHGSMRDQHGGRREQHGMLCARGSRQQGRLHLDRRGSRQQGPAGHTCACSRTCACEGPR